MLFRPSRSQRGPDRFLNAKMVLLAAGGAMAFGGFILQLDWLVMSAIAPLVIGLGLNLARTRGDDSAPGDPAPGDTADPDGIPESVDDAGPDSHAPDRLDPS